MSKIGFFIGAIIFSIFCYYVLLSSNDIGDASLKTTFFAIPSSLVSTTLLGFFADVMSDRVVNIAGFILSWLFGACQYGLVFGLLVKLIFK